MDNFELQAYKAAVQQLSQDIAALVVSRNAVQLLANQLQTELTAAKAELEKSKADVSRLNDIVDARDAEIRDLRDDLAYERSRRELADEPAGPPDEL